MYHVEKNAEVTLCGLGYWDDGEIARTYSGEEEVRDYADDAVEVCADCDLVIQEAAWVRRMEDFYGG